MTTADLIHSQWEPECRCKELDVCAMQSLRQGMAAPIHALGWHGYKVVGNDPVMVGVSLSATPGPGYLACPGAEAVVIYLLWIGTTRKGHVWLSQSLTLAGAQHISMELAGRHTPATGGLCMCPVSEDAGPPESYEGLCSSHGVPMPGAHNI